MTDQEKEYVNNLIMNALTVETDEKEGQQVINLLDIDACAADYELASDVSLFDNQVLEDLYTDEDLIKILNTPPEKLPEILNDLNTNTNVILEFADANVADPNPVKYEITIKPGEAINNDSILGSIEQRGKMKTLKSIFSKGNVKGINDNQEYFHLYPSNCSRHIVLENVQPDNGNDYDISRDMEEINDKFKEEGILYALITNNMCQSLLPFILSRRYRGVYTRTFNVETQSYSKWYLDSSDFIMDNTEVSTYIDNDAFKGGKQFDSSLIVYDTINESLSTGVKIFDASVLKILDDIQDDFGANIIGNDITKSDMKSWKKRAKKKRKRKRVKKEINEKIQNSVNKIKKSESPYDTINKEKDRLLQTRDNYVNSIIDLYNNKDNFPLCKYNPDYDDCKYLVNDDIDKSVLNNVESYDEDFTYYKIGDVDNYYNYYTSLLGNINLSLDDEYTKEYYNIITDIINKRLIVEGKDATELKLQFFQLVNDNISPIFNLYKNNIFNTEEYINTEFTKFENKIQVFMQNMKTTQANNIRDEFTKMELGEQAIENATQVYTSSNLYTQAYEYLKNLYTYENDEDDEAPNEIISQLATLFYYIKSYGTGTNNKYKNITTEDNQYLYFELVKEEAQKICDFWDKAIKRYNECRLENCINDFNELTSRFDQYADWPVPTNLTINDINYKHYLFKNLYPEPDIPIDISIGDFNFPDDIIPPEIPDDIDVDENWAIEQLNNHEVEEPKDNKITILDFKYWQKYFTLATLICLTPSCWNCGLDIMPYIQFIKLPCIFICIKVLFIPIFNLLIVFGLSVRGMYVWPIVLYLNLSNSPLSIMTPLVAVVGNLKMLLEQKIQTMEYQPIYKIAGSYINKFNSEINELKKENIRLEVYKRAIKQLKFPGKVNMAKEFNKIYEPLLDTRMKYLRLELLAQKNRQDLEENLDKLNNNEQIKQTEQQIQDQLNNNLYKP